MRAALVAAAPAVRRFLFTMCGDWHQADDLAQEALLRAWRKRESYNGRAAVQTWVFTIARNHWLDRLRRGRSAPRVELSMHEHSVADRSPGPREAASRAEFRSAVSAALAALPAEQREALALRESEGLTFAQAADVLGVPVGTVKSRVRYALLKLAEKLEPFRGEGGP
jgi:RNA polymerase sigma-70 factor (ECF subfamily)